MSLQPLEALWPEQTLNYKNWRRSLKRRQRHIISAAKKQYYLTNALADARLAFSKNEDIALASVLLIGFLSFSGLAVFGNAVYTFVLAASAMSTFSGLNLALMVLVAVAVVAVLYAWLTGFLQNLLSIALYEGAAKHPKRSLRRTVRISLNAAAMTATAWILLLLAATIPLGALDLSVLIAAHLLHIKLAAALPYTVATSLIGLGWAIWVLANYTLTPYVSVFENQDNWDARARRARRLVERKGRLFILGGYLSCLAVLGAAYVLGLGLQAIIHIDSTPLFALLSVGVLSIANTVFTMLYRKRRLARS